MAPLSPAQIACLLVATVAAILDLKTKKIPNWLTFPAAILGVILQYMASGQAGAVSALEGWVLAVAMMLATRPFGWPFGMGDVKLVAAIGSFLGPGDVLIVFFWFFLSFAPVAWYRIAASLPWKGLIGAMPSFLKTHDPQLIINLDWSGFNKARKAPLLFGPFYAAGAFLAILLSGPTRALLGFK